MPSEVLQDMPSRLKAAAAAVADAKDAYDLKKEQRNELVVRAVDEGMSQSKVAELIGVKSKGSVHKILTGSDPDAAGDQ